MTSFAFFMAISGTFRAVGFTLDQGHVLLTPITGFSEVRKISFIVEQTTTSRLGHDCSEQYLYPGPSHRTNRPSDRHAVGDPTQKANGAKTTTSVRALDQQRQTNW